MTDRGIFYERASEAIDALNSSLSSQAKVHILVDMALVEATHILEKSQRLLVETLAEANRLKRIELGMSEPVSTDYPAGETLPSDSPLVAKPWDSIPDLSGQRPPDAPSR